MPLIRIVIVGMLVLTLHTIGLVIALGMYILGAAIKEIRRQTIIRKSSRNG